MFIGHWYQIDFFWGGGGEGRVSSCLSILLKKVEKVGSISDNKSLKLLYIYIYDKKVIRVDLM
jgi:hypothetical protein